MGFSIKSIVGGGIGGVLRFGVGGPLGALVGAGIGSGFLGGDSEEAKLQFAQAPESQQAQAARAELFALTKEKPPEIPTRGIAGIGERTEEQKLARATAKELIQPVDILKLPEVQGTIQRTVEEGNLLANRLGRGLQATGSFTTTGGRDVLGRAVTNIQERLTAQLAPFIENERRRRASLIPFLEGVGLSDLERTRLFEQAGLDATFAQEFGTSRQTQDFTVPLLQSIIGLQPAQIPIVSGGGASDPLGGFGSIIGPLLGASIGGGGFSLPGFGGGGSSLQAKQAADFADLSR